MRACLQTVALWFFCSLGVLPVLAAQQAEAIRDALVACNRDAGNHEGEAPAGERPYVLVPADAASCAPGCRARSGGGVPRCGAVTVMGDVIAPWRHARCGLL